MSNNDLDNSIDALDFAVEKSMRYHQRRRGYYDFLHKRIMLLTLISGSAAFANFLIDPKYFGAAAALCAAIDLVWGPSHRARDHEILFRRFSGLAIAIRTSSCQNSELLSKWKKERITIETDEPPIYWALEADCDNEVCRAWGRDQKLLHISWWYRITMYYLRHTESNFDQVSKKCAI